jgi:hypothetical protein
MESDWNMWLNYCALQQVQVKLHFNINKLIQALQSAHLCCLSLDLLSSSCLRDLFDAVTLKAKAHQHQLLIHHPSDLLQIEASYIHDSQDVQLILHVLMTAADSILRLFQLHPFPLPFTDRHFLMPDPTNQNFAILSGAECLSLEMSAVNLMGCHCINLVYLREQHRVLMRELNAT